MSFLQSSELFSSSFRKSLEARLPIDFLLSLNRSWTYGFSL